MSLKKRMSCQNQLLDTIAAHLFTLLRIIIFALILLSILSIFIKIYTQPGIVVLPFEIKNENLSGIAIADQITSELLRIQQIHTIKYKVKILSKDHINFEAGLSADLSPSNLNTLVPKTETMKFSMADIGTISTGYGSLDPGKLIIAFKNICPASKPDTTIRGSLQRYGPNIILVAVLEGNKIQSWMVRQPVDNNNEVQLYEMIRNLTFMIAHDLPQSNVSAKTWEGLRYYTEALDAYNQYELTGNLDAIYRAGNYSLKAISSEKGYRNPYDLIRTLEFEFISIGTEHNESNCYNRAIELCNETIELDPSSEYGWENKANVLCNLNRYDEAIQAYDIATRSNPQCAEAWNDKGSALSRLKKYDEAIRAYNEAIRIDPNYAYARNNKGLALEDQGKLSDAINAYDEAIRINPNYANAWSNKGSALEAQGEYNKAIQACNRAININPQYVDAWNIKGSSLRSLGKYNDAISAHDRAIRLDSNYAYSWNFKGLALRYQEKFNDSINAYDEAIRINPNYANAWSNKGVVLYLQGKYDEAIQAYDEAIRLDPNYSDARNGKGNVLVKQGKYDDAIRALDEAIRLDSNDSYAWNKKGIALDALGRDREAAAAFTKAKDLGYSD